MLDIPSTAAQQGASSGFAILVLFFPLFKGLCICISPVTQVTFPLTPLLAKSSSLKVARLASKSPQVVSENKYKYQHSFMYLIVFVSTTGTACVSIISMRSFPGLL